MNQLSRWTSNPIEVVNPNDKTKDNFGQAFMVGLHAADDMMQRGWDRLEDEWLKAKREKSGSDNTTRAYKRVVEAWKDWCVMQRNSQGETLRLWQVEARHVREWQRHLRDEKQLAESSINQHLASVSSYYSFVSAEKFMINGQELCLFSDTVGATRANPFKFGNVQRGKTEEYERAKLLPDNELGNVLRHLQEHTHTLQGSRANALFLMYFLTGWRNAEVLRMQWKHIRPHKDLPATFVFAWKGKGAKKDDVQIPPDALSAMIAYLKKDGRWTPGIELLDQPFDPDMYIWRRLDDRTLDHLNGVKEKGGSAARSENEPISGKNALRIFKTILKNAGVKGWEGYRLHDLRHLFAVMNLEDGASETEVMQKMHHSNLATTGRYTNTIRKKRKDQALMDNRSGRLFQKALGL